MTGPSIDRAAAAVGELSTSVRLLTDEVKAAEALREDKIRWIQRSVIAAGVAVVVLGILVIANIALLSRTKNAADAASSTNSFLQGCFQPHTTCSEQSARQQATAFNTLRQTEFVFFWCSRSNPLPPNPTPAQVDAGRRQLATCVQSYYPGFVLPPKAAPSPKPTPGRLH